MKRKVRGLLDVTAAEAAGEEWVVESPSSEFFPGMGFGAMPEATEYAYRGWIEKKKRAPRRKRGRPKLQPGLNIDCIRAFAAWEMCQNLRRTMRRPNANIPVKELISAIQFVENRLDFRPEKRLFPGTTANLDQSVSRGKRNLGIDRQWNSETCEEIKSHFPQVR